MGVYEALRVLGIRELNKLTDLDVKTAYRKMMGKHHPDRGGDTHKAQMVNEAYGVLKVALKKLDGFNARKSNDNVIIDFGSLYGIYGGTPTRGNGSNGVVEISRNNIRLLNTFIEIKIDIVINGMVRSFYNFNKWNSKDEYVIRCEIPASIGEVGMELRAYGKKVEFVSKGKTVLNLNFGYKISLRVEIERSIEVNG